MARLQCIASTGPRRANKRPSAADYRMRESDPSFRTLAGESGSPHREGSAISRLIVLFLRRFLVDWWVPSPGTPREICGSLTANSASYDCHRMIMCSHLFHGPHLDARILRLFWLRILCMAACGSDFRGGASAGFVMARSARPTRPPMD